MSWITIKLSELTEVYSGFAFKSKDLTDEGGIPVIKIKNIHDRIVDKNVQTYLPKKLFIKKYEKYILEKQDILIAMTGQGSVGRIGKMMSFNDEYLVNQRVGIIRANEKELDSEYLYQCLATKKHENYYFNLAVGAGQPNLSPKDIGSLEITIPKSINTQKKIASILSAYDDLIENNLKRIKLLEESAQRLYKEWFVDFKFPNHENTPINPETGLPDGWERSNLFNIANVTTGYPFKSKDFNTEKLGRPAVRIRDIPNQLTQTFINKEVPEKYNIHRGDILIGMDGFFYIDIWCGQTDSVLVQRVCKITTLNGLSQGYLLEALKPPIKYFEKTISGATVAHLGIKHLKEIDIIIPSIEIDLAIFDKMNKEKINLFHQNQNLKEARDLLLPRLMNRTIEV